MRITAKGEYALRALLELSGTYDNNDVHSLDEISDRQGIPHQFLVQIFQSLRHARIVESRRGSAGGYKLAVSPREISVGQVLELVEGELFATHNGAIEDTDSAAGIASLTLREFWGELEHSIRRVVDRTTLYDLRDRLVKNNASMFYI